MKIAALLSSLAVAAAAHNHEALKPSRTHALEKRATKVCGQWDSVETGGYTIYNNLWGRDEATSGSQCMTVDDITNGLVQWSTTWSWQGGPLHVKSYPNAVLKAPAARVSTVSSIPSTWRWS